MDEENKNNNQNLENKNNSQVGENKVQQLQDDVKQTTNAVKDGANLAKNASTGNYLGAAKDAAKLLSNKKVRKKIIINGIMNFLAPFILILMLGAILLGIFDAIGGIVSDVVSGVVDFFTIDESDGSIKIDDEDVDAIINSITDSGVNPADLWLLGDVEEGTKVDSPEYQEALRTYVRKFYEAQLVTETLNYYHKETTDSKTYGAIYVYRATSENAEENRKELTYIPYDEMKKYDEEDNLKALDHFSVDEATGQLVVAGTVEVIGEKGTGSNKAEAINNLKVVSDVVTVNLVNIDYKSAVAPYTTRLEFLLYLTMISQNPEFVSAVTDLIKDSRIELTIMDSVSENVQTYTYEYTQHTRTKHEYTDSEGNTHSYYSESSSDKAEATRTTTITTTPSAYITYVKTWFCEQEIKYKKVTDPTIVDDPIITKLPDESKPSGEGSWKTNQVETLENETTNTSYRESYREAVKLIVGERGDRDRYASGQIPEPTFVGLMETEFDIPNSTRTAEAGTNLVSGSEMLFFLLQKDSKLENMEMIMRYALNKYTNTDDYGKNFDDLYDSLEINMLQVGADYVVDTTRSESSLVITDEDTLIKAITALYYGETRKNLLDEVSSFLEMQNQYNVNAVFAISVTIIESSGGTNWAAIAPFTHNWMSVTGSYNGNTYKKPGSSNPRTWRVYPSFREATLDFGDLIANSEYYFKSGKYSVDMIAPTYCNSYWGAKVSSEMTKIYNSVGIEVPTADSSGNNMNISGIIEGGVTSDSEAKELQNTIEQELLNTKVHSNGEYQNGPFEKWWSYPYNSLDPFQCTWWANGRASMYLELTYGAGKRYPTQRGNGGDYYSINAQNGWFEYGSSPRPNSIISWTSGEYGHVAYVEGVTEDSIFISHAGYGNAWYGVQEIPLDEVNNKFGRLNGYIYLDSPKNWEA